MITSYGQHLLTVLRQRLLVPDAGIGKGDQHITIEDIRFEQEGSENEQLVILFRETRRSHCLFGFRPHSSYYQRSASDDEAVGDMEEIYANLQERVEATNMGLPENCKSEGITWI